MARIILCTVAILMAFCSCIATDNTTTMLKSGRFGQYTRYFVYTRDAPRVGQEIYATTASASAVRTLKTKTVIIIHGQGLTHTTTLNPVVKDALLTAEDVSVIAVDWSLLAAMPDNILQPAVPEISANIAELIRLFVNARKITVDNLHIVGFGLGAHIAGIVARTVTGTVARITALDPTNWSGTVARLQASDAGYVEVIHTDSAGVGLADSIGHVDFFPNGGITQPGCANSDCNHDRAWQYFASSLTHPNGLTGNLCNANASPSDNNCRGYSMTAGNNELRKYGSGSFFLSVSDKYPYHNELNCVLACMD